MLEQTLIALSLLTSVNFSNIAITTPSANFAQERVLAKKDFDLTDRLPNKGGSDIFADNIVLSLHYLKGDVNSLKTTPVIVNETSLDWQKVRAPFEVSFKLEKGEVFAFDNNAVLPEYKGRIKASTNSKFYMQEGYKSLAGLGGNGVCHLASLINWVSQDAGLKVVAKVNHDFWPIPDVPREYGTSIFSTIPEQNLYIENTKDNPVEFKFDVEKNKITLKITE